MYLSTFVQPVCEFICYFTFLLVQCSLPWGFHHRSLQQPTPRSCMTRRWQELQQSGGCRPLAPPLQGRLRADDTPQSLNGGCAQQPWRASRQLAGCQRPAKPPQGRPQLDSDLRFSHISCTARRWPASRQSAGCWRLVPPVQGHPRACYDCKSGNVARRWPALRPSGGCRPPAPPLQGRLRAHDATTLASLLIERCWPSVPPPKAARRLDFQRAVITVSQDKLLCPTNNC